MDEYGFLFSYSKSHCYVPLKLWISVWASVLAFGSVPSLVYGLLGFYPAWRLSDPICKCTFNTEGYLLRLRLPECWVVSKLHMLIDAVTESYNKYFFGDVGREIYDFFWGDFADRYNYLSSKQSKRESRWVLRIVKNGWSWFIGD
ncbi:uncharacterized protein LOC105787376 isoform X2 [Gossypium raimondii]|uniref:uncharacterized protein LOC105787376 isoform X2 n=1 Tax=Gossypium raimondii TaxID=29730 RepID=UPI00227A1BA8|nr:uncharacterized protein LOC105787376 isoform X2 [Gossypium raimondii]